MLFCAIPSFTRLISLERDSGIAVRRFPLILSHCSCVSKQISLGNVFSWFRERFNLRNRQHLESRTNSQEGQQASLQECRSKLTRFSQPSDINANGSMVRAFSERSRCVSASGGSWIKHDGIFVSLLDPNERTSSLAGSLCFERMFSILFLSRSSIFSSDKEQTTSGNSIHCMLITVIITRHSRTCQLVACDIQASQLRAFDDISRQNPQSIL